MRKRKISNVLFWTIAIADAALLTGFLLALAGVVPVDSATDEPPPVEQQVLPASETAPATTRAAARPATPSAPPRTRPDLASVVITATRGESWFSARLGSENGRVLDERLLAQGASARFEGERIWLIVGAAGNVDITVDGKRRPISSGTVSLVLTGAPADTSS